MRTLSEEPVSELPLPKGLSTSSPASNLESVDGHFGPSHLPGTRPSPNFWVLKDSLPHNKWAHWPGATLSHETADSMFIALSEITGDSTCNTIGVELQTPRDEFSFELQRHQPDRFLDLKAFMLQAIDASHCAQRFGHPVINIYLRPAAR